MHYTATWLAPGHALLRHPAAEQWRMFTPDGAVIEVDTTVLAPELSAYRLAASPGAAAALFARAGFGPATEILAAPAVERAASEPDDPIRVPGARVVLHGTGTVSAAVAALISAAGQTVLRAGDPAAPLAAARASAGAAPLTVVSCSDGPADPSWTAVEQALLPGDHWLRVSVEGGYAYLEPPVAGETAVTHRMVRARRLGAAPWPDDLHALWSTDLVLGPHLIGERTAGLLARWILQDLAGISAAAGLGDRGRELRRLDLRTGRHTSHRVLPVPRGTHWRERVSARAGRRTASTTPAPAAIRPTGVRIGWSGAIRLDDGAALHTVIVEPPGDPAAPPTLVWRTPYGTGSHLSEAFGWARRGCRVVLQDVRGRYNSTGDFEPYRNEEGDGLATVEHLRRNGCDGELIAYGGSYAAHCALALAGRIALDGVLLAVPALDHASCIRERNGAPRLYAHAHWWTEHGDARAARGPIAALQLDQPGAFDSLPVSGLPNRWGLHLPGFTAAWAATAGHPAGHGIDALRGRLATGAHPVPPLMCLAGWADAFTGDAIELWRSWPNPSATLVIGPWTHALRTDPQSPWNADCDVKAGSLAAAWVMDNSRIRSGGEKFAASAVQSLCGAQTSERSVGWHCWPLQDPPSRQLPLTTDRPGPFLADPAAPHPSRLGRVPVDDLLDREDAHLWWSGPLTGSVVMGAPTVLLDGLSGTGAPRAHWAVRLLLEVPGTPVVQLATGCAASIETALRIELSPMHLCIPAGARLGVQVSGHQFPLYPRDPQNGSEPLTATTARAAWRTVGDVRLRVPVTGAPEPVDVAGRWRRP